MANTLHNRSDGALDNRMDGDTMNTTDAMAILTAAGYEVRFSEGCWLVSPFEGCTEKLNRLELVELAKAIRYIG